MSTLKELPEAVAAIGELAHKIHERIEDGFQPLTDLPAILSFALSDPTVQAGFAGFADFDDEAKRATVSEWLELFGDAFYKAAEEVREEGH